MSALVRHALGVVHGDKVSTIVVKMDGQVRRGGPGQTHVGGLGAPDGDPIELRLVVTAMFFPVHDDPEHLGLDYKHLQASSYIYMANIFWECVCVLEFAKTTYTVG